MHAYVRVSALLLLVSVLVWTSVEKLAPILDRSGAFRQSIWPVFGAASELTLVALLAWKKTRYPAALICCGAFLGISAVRAWHVLSAGQEIACGCLGVRPISHGQALMLAGLIVALASFVLHAETESTRASQSGPLETP